MDDGWTDVVDGWMDGHGCSEETARWSNSALCCWSTERLLNAVLTLMGNLGHYFCIILTLIMGVFSAN